MSSEEENDLEQGSSSENGPFTKKIIPPRKNLSSGKVQKVIIPNIKSLDMAIDLFHNGLPDINVPPLKNWNRSLSPILPAWSKMKSRISRIVLFAESHDVRTLFPKVFEEPKGRSRRRLDH